jgi:hypothetical protein
MKINPIIPALLASLVLGLTFLPVSAHEKSEHGPKKVAGPNGGRILPGTDPRTEFFVTGDRKVQITFIDHHGNVVTPSGQTVVVTAGDRAAPTRLDFSPTGKVLLSNVALPAGPSVPTVVQITPAPNAKPVTTKFNVNLAVCPECKNAEYACICEGH